MFAVEGIFVPKSLATLPRSAQKTKRPTTSKAGACVCVCVCDAAIFWGWLPWRKGEKKEEKRENKRANENERILSGKNTKYKTNEILKNWIFEKFSGFQEGRESVRRPSKMTLPQTG